MSGKIYVSRGDDLLGPYTISEATRMVRNGTLSADDLATFEGEETSQPLADLIPKTALSTKGVPKRRVQVNRAEQSELMQGISSQSFVCPSCGKDTVQNARVLYEGGTMHSQSVSRTTGVASTEDGLAFAGGATQTKTTQQTHLARRFAPPAPPVKEKTGLVLGIVALTVFVICGLFAMRQYLSGANMHGHTLAATSVVVGGLFGWLANAAATKEKARHAEANRFYQQNLLRWQHSYLCHTCGYFGLLNSPNLRG